MNYNVNYILNTLKKTKLILLCAFCFVLNTMHGQIETTIDSTSIKIGEEIIYKIKVETDTTNMVVFPEGQTFLPLEMIESYKTDTTQQNDTYQLIKKYGLTQFDSGVYYIPKQKIVLGDKVVYTDSLKVEVANVVVDTTKQGLYNIKPIINVSKTNKNWWKWILIPLLIIGLIGFLLYWFLWRKKPLTEEEKIALLPAYDRAKIALAKLEKSQYLIKSEIKEYYSELTDIIRSYLDEKVYNRALESTTNELITHLHVLKDSNQIQLSKDTIANFETIFKRADLVKFAKSAPDTTLAQLDKKTIDKEIDHVKQALPEPTEEEKLLDEQYRLEQERKQKRKKIIITVAAAVFLLFATLIGFGIKYGFTFVKDTIIGHESKELLEGKWVTSDYGFPPITISTPKVLKRIELPLPEELKEQVKMTNFMHGTLLGEFSIMLGTTTYLNLQSQTQYQNTETQQPQIDLQKVVEGSIQGMEQQGAKDIVVKTDKFVTPNAAEGLKTYGTMKAPILGGKKLSEANYAMFHFTSNNILQQIIITWPQNDTYADNMVERITNSIELVKPNK